MDRRDYRSYVIRAWTRGSGGGARVHVRIERVESGEQVDLDGSAAGSLAASVEEAIRVASRALGDGDGAAEPGGPTGRAEPVEQRATVGGDGDGRPVPGERG